MAFETLSGVVLRPEKTAAVAVRDLQGHLMACSEQQWSLLGSPRAARGIAWLLDEVLCLLRSPTVPLRETFGAAAGLLVLQELFLSLSRVSTNPICPILADPNRNTSARKTYRFRRFVNYYLWAR